jgi:hypothetical protein
VLAALRAGCDQTGGADVSGDVCVEINKTHSPSKRKICKASPRARRTQGVHPRRT